MRDRVDRSGGRWLNRWLRRTRIDGRAVRRLNRRWRRDGIDRSGGRWLNRRLRRDGIDRSGGRWLNRRRRARHRIDAHRVRPPNLEIDAHPRRAVDRRVSPAQGCVGVLNAIFALD